jgi:hypothetical protein
MEFSLIIQSIVVISISLVMVNHLKLQLPSGLLTPTTLLTKSSAQAVSTNTKSFLSAYQFHYNFSSFQPIQKIVYTNDMKLMTLIKNSSNQPFLLQKSPSNQWSALKKWANLIYLQHNLPKPLARVTTVRAGYPYIYTSDTRPLAKFPQSQRVWWQHTTENQILFSQFSSRCSDTTFYDYVQGWNSDFETLSADLLDPNYATTVNKEWIRLPKESRQQVWMSCHKLSGSHVHHDQSHNIVIQLVGSKRFILTPTKEWNKFRDSPRISRFVSFSQRNFSAIPSQFSANEMIQESVDITLHPGDILYIPPFYWHHVQQQSSNLTIGTNIFIPDSRIQLKTLLAMPLPTNVHVTNKSARFRRTATSKMIEFLIENILSFKTGGIRKNDYIHRIFMNRYINSNRASILGDHLQKECTTILKCNRIFEKSIETQHQTSYIPLEELHDIVRNQIRSFQHWMTDDSLYPLPSETAVQMMLSDYIEELISYVVGPRNVCHFLRCMISD